MIFTKKCVRYASVLLKIIIVCCCLSLSSDLKDLQNHQENAYARAWFYGGLKP